MAKELIYDITANADAGNSSTKVIVGGSQATIIENYRATRTSVDYTGTGIEYANSNNGGISCLHLRVKLKGEQEREFLFGDMAKDWDSARDFDGQANKHNNNIIIENSVASIAACFAQNAIILGKEVSENIKLNIALSTGLPVLEYANEKNRHEYSNRLIGEHTVEFLSPYFKKNGIKKITVNIERVDLNREGEAALNSLARISEHPIITENQDLLIDGQLVSGIDIGKGSTDIITAEYEYIKDKDGNIVEDNGRYFERLKVLQEKCIPMQGISKDYKEVMIALKPIDTENELNMISVEQSLKRKPEALRGKVKELGNHDMLPTFRNVIKFHTDEIAEAYRKTVKDQRKILTIYVSGGASEIPEVIESLKESFIRAYTLTGIQAEKFSNRIVKCNTPNPVIANVEGYYGMLEATLEAEGNSKYKQIFA